jgi:hypothetical protein
LVRTQVAPSRFTVASHGETLSLQSPRDLYVSTVRETDRVRIEAAPMIFVGYGVTAPERGWDDFGDVDLRGKIAVFLVNDPDFEAAPGDAVAGRFGGRSMTYYGRWTYKFEEAARRGATGALVIHESEGAGYGWNTVQAPSGEAYNVVLRLPPDRPWRDLFRGARRHRGAGRKPQCDRPPARTAAARDGDVLRPLGRLWHRPGRCPRRHDPQRRP